MIFYFSATGNSLYAAKSLDNETVSIPQIIGREELRFRADRIGIAAPIYGHELPQMVKEFIRRADLETDYLYGILTYGNRHASAVELAQNVFRDAGKEPAYLRTVLMVDNFLPAFDMAEQTAIDKHVDEQLAEARADIRAKRHWIEPVTDADRAAHADYVAMVEHRPEKIWADLEFTDQCIGCGICTKVCPAGCIRLDRQRAVRSDANCQACLACVHACPERAIRMSPVCGFEEPNPEARYRNEHVSLKELICANWRGKYICK